MNQETFEKTVVAHVETLVERDALEELLKHPLLADLPRAEGYPVLGSYVLFAQLGSGGMANVFRGVHIRLENEVAIKIRTAPVGTAAARFQREATVAAKLEHQNLVRATDVDEIGGLQYMVLDYIDGEDADERVARKGALDPIEALTIIRDSALGLAEAHRLDFIHRDIKPANVMISREGRVKLADLGLAKSVVDDDLGLTATGGLLGTPMYMAPEQFRRAEEIVKASDVYGLGVTLVFLLTGRHPFNGKSVPEIMQQVCVQGVARLDQTLPNLDPRIVQLVAEIVALKVEDRPRDGAALAVRIDEVLSALGGGVELSDNDAGASKARGVHPPNKVARTRIKAAATRVEAGTASSTAVVEEKGSMLRWVAAVMLLAAAGGIGWTVWEKQKTEGGTRTEPRDPNELALTATSQDAQEIPFDTKAITGTTNDHVDKGEWNEGYRGLLVASKESSGEEELSALASVAEGFSRSFQDAHRYDSKSGLLSDDGEEALLDLADLMGSQAPLTSLTAAELGVEFNGLRYEIDDALRASTDRFLSRSAREGDDDVKARSKLLQGVLLVNDYMGNPSASTGQNARDILVDAAEKEPDSEAAAWLGILYLSFLDHGTSVDDIPIWFSTKTMVELLETSLREETHSGDAASVMGHLYSGGLAQVPKSMDKAKELYVLGARRGHLGCVSDAVFCAADLKGRLSKDTREKMEHFAGSQTRDVSVHAREAYALAALTASFKEGDDPARRAKAIQFLRDNAEVELSKGLETDRQFDRLTICLGAMLRETPLEVGPWIEEHLESLTKGLYRDGPPRRSLPTWLLLADFDAELARRIFVAGMAPDVQKPPADALAGIFRGALDADDYADVPFVWSFIEPVIAALEDR